MHVHPCVCLMLSSSAIQNDVRVDAKLCMMLPMQALIYTSQHLAACVHHHKTTPIDEEKEREREHCISKESVFD